MIYIIFFLPNGKLVPNFLSREISGMANKSLLVWMIKFVVSKSQQLKLKKFLETQQRFSFDKKVDVAFLVPN